MNKMDMKRPIHTYPGPALMIKASRGPPSDGLNPIAINT